MTDEQTRVLSRRAVLAGAAAIPVLAACGSGDGDDGDDADSAESSPSPSESSSSPAPSATNAPSEAASASPSLEGTRFPAADIPVEGGIIEDGIVVTQPSAGTFKAFDASCTHQGCDVTSVQDNTISCPCHGSRYSAEDGSVLQGPAPRALSALTATVDGSDVVVA
jgi:Rieske Fe-S protein